MDPSETANRVSGLSFDVFDEFWLPSHIKTFFHFLRCFLFGRTLHAIPPAHRGTALTKCHVIRIKILIIIIFFFRQFWAT
jgi:hypothetical protein